MSLLLSPASSEAFLKTLRKVRGERKLSLAEVGIILGCSGRTAARLLKLRASSSVKLSYARNLARHLRLVEPPWERGTRGSAGIKAVLNAWRAAAKRPARRRVAWRLLALLSEQAHLSHGLSVTSVIHVPHTGEPTKITLSAAAPRTRAVGKLTIHFDLKDRDSLTLVFTDRLGRDVYNGELTSSVVDNILSQIRSWQKAQH